MSTRAETLKGLHASTILNTVFRFIGEYSIELQGRVEAKATGVSNIVTVPASNLQEMGLASLIGKYDNDPSWDEFPAFLEQYRREIDEMSRD